MSFPPGPWTCERLEQLHSAVAAAAVTAVAAVAAAVAVDGDDDAGRVGDLQWLAEVRTQGFTPAMVSLSRGRAWRIMPAEKLAEFGTFSGKFHACLVCG